MHANLSNTVAFLLTASSSTIPPSFISTPVIHTSTRYVAAASKCSSFSLKDTKRNDARTRKRCLIPTIVLTAARLPRPPFPRRADIPNLLTYVRIAAIPILAFTTLCMTPSACMTSSLIFTMAALTDWLDGYLARRWEVTSPLGVFLDPVADKLIVAVALIGLSARFPLPIITVPTAVIICREILISALREWMALSGKSATVKVSTLGKLKTATQMISIAMLLATPFALSPLARIGALLLMVSAVLTIASAAQYVSAAVAALK